MRRNPSFICTNWHGTYAFRPNSSVRPIFAKTDWYRY